MAFSYQKKKMDYCAKLTKKYKTLCGLQGIFRGKRYQRSVYMIAFYLDIVYIVI